MSSGKKEKVPDFIGLTPKFVSKFDCLGGPKIGQQVFLPIFTCPEQHSQFLGLSISCAAQFPDCNSEPVDGSLKMPKSMEQNRSVCEEVI